MPVDPDVYGMPCTLRNVLDFHNINAAIVLCFNSFVLCVSSGLVERAQTVFVPHARWQQLSLQQHIVLALLV